MCFITDRFTVCLGTCIVDTNSIIFPKPQQVAVKFLNNLESVWCNLTDIWPLTALWLGGPHSYVCTHGNSVYYVR